MSNSCNALSSKAKCMYGSMLKSEHYDELMKKKELSDLTHYLKEETYYKDILKDVREYQVHRGQLEQLLFKDYYTRMNKLLRYKDLKCPGFFHLFVVSQEIHFILHHIALMVANEEDSLAEVPLFYDDIICFDLMELASCKTMKQLLKCLEKTPYYKMIKKYEKAMNYITLEIEMMRYYHKHSIEVIEKEIKGKGKPSLLELAKMKSELVDISLIYRCKFHFQMDQKEIKSYLMNQMCYLRPYHIEMLLNSNINEFKIFLKDSKYHIHFESGDLEHECNKFLYQKAKKMLNFENDPYCIFNAYELIAKKELDNLIHIIEGIHYEINEDELKKMIIY